MLTRWLVVLVGAVLATAGPLDAATLRIAAAANLRGTLDQIVTQYAATGSADGIEVSITHGSTGKLYAQIVHGAPFDLFFGADVEHARRLEEEGLAVTGSRFTYALGRLALWSRESKVSESTVSESLLRDLQFSHLAIASPRVAPYGRAAREVLESTGLWPEIEAKAVYGEDVGKVFHFAQSGAAEVGFVPLSLVRRSTVQGGTWIVPEGMYAPIEQQAVQLRESATASDFLDFVRGDHARATFETRGYALP